MTDTLRFVKETEVGKSSDKSYVNNYSWRQACSSASHKIQTITWSFAALAWLL